MKDQIPKLTLLMAAYNEETYIKQSIRCVLENSYRDCELIIADDASTDRTQDLILEITESNTSGIPIEYIRREKNIGNWANFNDLIKRARGEYICFMGQHDLVSKDYFLKLVNRLEKDKNAVLSFAHTQWIDREGNYGKEDLSYAELCICSLARFIALMFLGQNYMYGVMRRDAVMKTHLFRQVTHSDGLFLQELGQQGTFLICPTERFYRRQNRNIENTIERNLRYKKGLFSSRWQRFRFSFFPTLQLMFRYMALAFTIRGISKKRRFGIVCIYPMIFSNFFPGIKFDIRNLGKW